MHARLALVLHGGGPFLLHARLAAPARDRGRDTGCGAEKGSDAEESGRNEDPGTCDSAHGTVPSILLDLGGAESVDMPGHYLTLFRRQVGQRSKHCKIR